MLSEKYLREQIRKQLLKLVLESYKLMGIKPKKSDLFLGKGNK